MDKNTMRRLARPRRFVARNYRGVAGPRRCGSSRQRVQQPRAKPSAPWSVVFALVAVRCFIFDERRKIKMSVEATIELGFDRVEVIFICLSCVISKCSGRSVDFRRPHYLPGQTQGAGHLYF